MFGIADAHHFRKLVAGVCMLLAPLCLLVATIVLPELSTNSATQLAAVADSPDRWYLGTLLALCGGVLAVPVILGFMHMLREREAAWGHLGGAFALVGLLAMIGVGAMSMVVWQMPAGGDQAAMAALMDRVNDTTGTLMLFAIVPFAFCVGMCFLAFGMFRARVIHWSMALCLSVGAIALNVGLAAGLNWLAIVAAAVLFVGSATIGRMVLLETDEEWEHTPEFRGFRPLMGAR